ncbi:hypothetical protein C1W84_32655, partial [Burkholderia pseudomallei]|nr:hypothetical protein [Burkholderia pseudomallei]NAX62025.1 hypothetical protein [Burkholderia pseudomallei]NAX78412.1 hypothetical protein [Burkholderia pseudomallei]NAX84939.1 hypothetical protein [Burkholderia pseudomallei]NAX91416.1 hypothetical protein [Burkholderia pseudomallei]
MPSRTNRRIARPRCADSFAAARLPRRRRDKDISPGLPRARFRPVALCVALSFPPHFATIRLDSRASEP